MSSPVRNVTLVGASGNVGALALEKLSASRHNVQVLRRTGSKSTLPPSVRVVDVDFASEEALTRALRGQDVVIVALPGDAAALQTTLADAAAAAGVRRFLPTEYGCNIENPRARRIPVFADKVKIEDHLRAKVAAGSSLTYTFVYNGPFLDWGIQQQFLLDVAGYKPQLLDDGKAVFSSANIDTLARAFVAIVDRLDETENRAVFLEDIKISQARLLELARQAAPDRPWEVSYVKLDDAVRVAGEGLAKGDFAFHNIAPFLKQAFLAEGYGGNFEKSDNELLGLGRSSEEFVLEQYKKLLQ
ncbi:hypothetical protein V2A60_005533 [Cordyceps javanica]